MSGKPIKPDPKLVGYARVSTDEQSTDPQLDELRQAGCSTIYQDVMSGVSRARPELRRALLELKAGQVLVVVRIDRLARSLLHLLEIIQDLERRGIGFRVLSSPIDTTTPQGKFMMQILGAVAEFERGMIKERTRAGVQAAASRGRLPGNPGMRRGDALAIMKIQAAKDAAYLERVRALDPRFRQVVTALRPDVPWQEVAATLNLRGVATPTGKGVWNRGTLQRAVRLLASHGLIDDVVLGAAPKKVVDPNLVQMVAMAARAAKDNPTLANVARELKGMRIKPPRGNGDWQISSVRLYLDHARAAGLLPGATRSRRRKDPAPAGA